MSNAASIDAAASFSDRAASSCRRLVPSRDIPRRRSVCAVSLSPKQVSRILDPCSPACRHWTIARARLETGMFCASSTRMTTYRALPRFLARLESRLCTSRSLGGRGPMPIPPALPPLPDSSLAASPSAGPMTAPSNGAKGGIDRAEETVRRVEPGRCCSDDGPAGRGLRLLRPGPRPSRRSRRRGKRGLSRPLRNQGGALLRQRAFACAGRPLADPGLSADLPSATRSRASVNPRELRLPAGEEGRPLPLRAVGSSQEGIELVHGLEAVQAVTAGLVVPAVHGSGATRGSPARRGARPAPRPPWVTRIASARAHWARQVSALSWVQTSRPV